MVTLGGGAATTGGEGGGDAVVGGTGFRVVAVFAGVVTNGAPDVTVVAGEWAAAGITVRALAAVNAVGTVDVVVTDGSSPPLTCDDAAPAKVVKTPVRPSARLERADNRRLELSLLLDPAADPAMATPVDGRCRRANTGTTAKLPQRAKMVTFRRLFDR